MNNATVSDTEVSFAASLYEALHRFKRVAAAMRRPGYRPEGPGDRSYARGRAACGSFSDVEQRSHAVRFAPIPDLAGAAT